MEIRIDGKPVYLSTVRQQDSNADRSVILIHGAGQDHTIWQETLHRLGDSGMHLLAVDLPGHGRTPGPCLQAIEQMADWMSSLIDVVGLGSPVLAGHSMGSLVALAVAATHPESVSALALVATAFPMPVSEKLLAMTKANDPAALELITKWSHSPAAKGQDKNESRQQMLDASTRLLQRCPRGVLHADLSACNNYTAGFEHASLIRCPTLLILGQRDVMTPVSATETLVANLDRAETIVLDGAGHALLAERPDEVSNMLGRFVGSIE